MEVIKSRQGERIFNFYRKKFTLKRVVWYSRKYILLW